MKKSDFNQLKSVVMKNELKQIYLRLSHFSQKGPPMLIGQYLQHLKWLLISMIVVVGCNSASDTIDRKSGADDLMLYAPTPMTESSPVFSVRAKTQSASSWQSIPVDFLFSVHYARLSGSGTLTFEITVPERIDNCTIHPQRIGIQHEIDSNTVVFSVTTQPRHLAVKINELQYLLLLIDSLEIDAPALTQRNVVNVKDFMTNDSSMSDQTENLQKAIDHLYNTKRKNILYFPPGIYEFRTLYFLNRTKPVTVYIEDGALLIKALRQSWNEEEAMFKIEFSSNISVKGRGVMDCNGKANNERWDRVNEGLAFPFWILDCENISIRDILMRNSAEWSTHCHYVRNLLISNYKVINPPECGIYWTDGLNISLGDNVLVENCFAYCVDDVFATGQHHYESRRKTTPLYRVIAADTKNFTIRNHFGMSGAGGFIRFGAQSMGYSIKNYRFENCDFMHLTNERIEGWDILFFRLKASYRDDHGRIDGVYDNISFINCSFENNNKPNSIVFKEGVTFGKLELINCTFDYSFRSMLNNIEELNVQDFKSGGKLRQTPEEAGFELTNVKQVNWGCSQPAKTGTK